MSVLELLLLLTSFRRKKSVCARFTLSCQTHHHLAPPLRNSESNQKVQKRNPEPVRIQASRFHTQPRRICNCANSNNNDDGANSSCNSSSYFSLGKPLTSCRRSSTCCCSCLLCCCRQARDRPLLASKYAAASKPQGSLAIFWSLVFDYVHKTSVKAKQSM